MKLAKTCSSFVYPSDMESLTL